MGRIGELLLALTLVTAAGDHGPDVVIQVTGQMQDQVADAVAEGKGFGPERPGGNRVNEVVDPLGQVLEVAGELIAGQPGEVGSGLWLSHGSSSPGGLEECDGSTVIEERRR